MTKMTKICSALVLTGLLSGCAGADLYLLLATGAAVKTTSVTLTRVVARGFGDLLGSGIGCALASGLNVFGPSVRIKMETVEFNFVAEEIRLKKIVDWRLLWSQLDEAESVYLRSLVQEAYDMLPSGSPLRTKPVVIYTDLLAAGLLNAVKDNVQVKEITFSRNIQVSKDPVRHESYTVSVDLLHAGNAERKNYSTCE